MAGAALALAGSATIASAAGVITNGSFTVGIGDNGELFDYASYIGFQRISDGYDPLSPGTPRDSWGVTTNLGSAWADQAYFGTSNLGGTTFTGLGGAAATATTVTGVGVELFQSYTFAAPNIVRIDHVITNTSTSALSLLFQRDWDTDPQPTFYNNSFGPVGASSLVVDSSYYGFEDPDPAAAYSSSCFTGCNVASDLGGGIKIGLPTLGAGQSTSFTYWYGISQDRQDVNGLIAQAFGVGVKYLIAQQTNENGDYPALGQNSSFIAVSDVPEPASWSLMIVGFGAIGYGLRQRRKAVTA
jgi:hypothetical protein